MEPKGRVPTTKFSDAATVDAAIVDVDVFATRALKRTVNPFGLVTTKGRGTFPPPMVRPTCRLLTALVARSVTVWRDLETDGGNIDMRYMLMSESIRLAVDVAMMPTAMISTCNPTTTTRTVEAMARACTRTWKCPPDGEQQQDALHSARLHVRAPFVLSRLLVPARRSGGTFTHAFAFICSSGIARSPPSSSR